MNGKAVGEVSFFDLPYKDKIAHFGFYFIFSIFWFIYLNKTKQSTSRFSMICIIFIIAVILGGIVELLQLYYTTTRSAEWADFFANCLGSGTALLLMHFVTTNKK